MEETPDAIGWRAVRQILAGLGQALLAFFLIPLALSPFLANWLRGSALGDLSPAHDLLSGYLRWYWGVLVVFGLGTALLVRLMAVAVLRLFRGWPRYKQAEEELASLTYLSGAVPDQRRKEAKQCLDQYFNAAMGHVICLLALPAAVLLLYAVILFVGGPSLAPIAGRLPQFQAELRQVESGTLETAEVWFSPRVDSGRLPALWGKGFWDFTVRCHAYPADGGSAWFDLLVPESMEFSPGAGAPFQEEQSIPWNLEHAQRYLVRYTSNFHLAVEITPIE